jgi:hypothetical protein
VVLGAHPKPRIGARRLFGDGGGFGSFGGGGYSCGLIWGACKAGRRLVDKWEVPIVRLWGRPVQGGVLPYLVVDLRELDLDT